jgi:hypothetical protein
VSEQVQGPAEGQERFQEPETAQALEQAAQVALERYKQKLLQQQQQPE